MVNKKIVTLMAILGLVLLTTFVLAVGAMASPYATQVIAYQAGSNAASGYTDPSTALGEPSRVTAGWPSGETDVTMFNAAWKPDQIVSIGAGGYLVLGFDHPVYDDPSNPYGIDLLVFGNAFFSDSDYPNGVAGGIWAEPANISVSQDRQTWYDISSVTADNLFPTQGYTDTSGPYANDGTNPSNFLKPVDPNIEWQGKTYSELLALYDGSGGGTGVDISETGLEWIQYVKLWQPEGDSWSAEIDGVADVAPVPIPAAVWLLGSGLLGLIGIRCKRA